MSVGAAIVHSSSIRSWISVISQSIIRSQSKYKIEFSVGNVWGASMRKYASFVWFFVFKCSNFLLVILMNSISKFGVWRFAIFSMFFDEIPPSRMKIFADFVGLRKNRDEEMLGVAIV